MSNRRFTVKDAGGGWILIDRPKGAIVTPRMVFSAPPNSLPKDEHDLRMWVYGLICRMWWDVTDLSGFQGAMDDASDIAAKIIRFRDKQEREAVS